MIRLRFGMGKFLQSTVLRHGTLAEGLAHLVGGKLSSPESSVDFTSIVRDALEDGHGTLASSAAADLRRFVVVDPALSRAGRSGDADFNQHAAAELASELGGVARGALPVLLFYKGFQAVTSARAANFFWREAGGHGQMIARLLQSAQSDAFGVSLSDAPPAGAMTGR